MFVKKIFSHRPDVHKHIPACSCMFERVQICPSVFKRVHACSSMFKRVQACSSMFERVQICLNCCAQVERNCVSKLKKDCSTRRLRAVKTVRATMDSMEPLLQKFPNFRIIHMTRDPRAVALSRSEFDNSGRGQFSIKVRWLNLFI